MSKKITGGCLCGGVRYECTAEPIVAGHCQCVDCRKDSGTGHGSHMMVPKDAVSISGKIRIFEKPADSGNIVGRAFCTNCGSSVYSLNSGMPDSLFLRASCLDDPAVFKPEMVVFTRRGPAWDHMDPDLPKFPGMPDM